jgi:hypothetical protein
MRIATYHLIECPRGMRVVIYHLIECLSMIWIVTYPLIECPGALNKRICYYPHYTGQSIRWYVSILITLRHSIRG